MSAICGLVHRDGQPVAPTAMDRLMTALEAYGPDGGNLWLEGAASLGHQMLHITPESLDEHLPWQDAVTELVITADARLDNREDLYGALAIPSQLGRDLSDAQLILRAYVKWGEHCPPKLLGDFAFAIWDARHQRLFCARDIFGIRPFFYYSSPHLFVFASDLNALLDSPEVPQQLNEALLAAYLQQEDLVFAQKSLTFYDRVYKLPPAHSLTLTPNKQEINCYWSPKKASRVRLNSEADYIEMLRDLLDQSVRCRLRSSFPIGAHLSGGLDSSAIAVAAARALRAERKTLVGFSWSPPLTTTPIDSAQDERHLVEEICRLEPITCHYISLTGQDMLNYRTRNFLTQPTEMLQIEQKVQAEVAGQNIRTVLSGWGGDEAITFNGRGYFAELFLKGHWWTLFRELKLRSELHKVGLRGQFIQKVVIPMLPDTLLPQFASLMDEHVQSSVRSAYINSLFAQRVQPLVDQLPRLPGLARERVGVRANQQGLLEDGHITGRIEAWAISGGQQNFVYSYPLLDQRIVEFALGIPVDLFFKHGWKRYLFRTATKGLLPDKVRWHKTKLEVASFAQLKSCGVEIREDVEEINLMQVRQNRHSSQLNEWLNMERLEQALMEKESPQPGIWQAASFATAFTEHSQTSQTNDCQTIPMS